MRKSIIALTALASLTMALAGSASAQGVPVTVASLQSQVTALQSQIASLQNAVKNVGSVGPKRVQFQSAASNQIAFINPETANDTNIVVVNGLSQMPSNLPVDTFGNQYKLAASISNTTPDDSWVPNGGSVVVAAGTPQYTAIYYCPHIICSGNNTVTFPSSQPVKITVMEISGLQGVIDGTPIISGSNANSMITPNNPNDIILYGTTDYNFAAGGNFVSGMIYYPSGFTSVNEPGNGIGPYLVGAFSVLFY